MTLAKAAVDAVQTGSGTCNIRFNNGKKRQFNAYDLPELLECWIDFCAGNSFRQTVLTIWKGFEEWQKLLPGK